MVSEGANNVQEFVRDLQNVFNKHGIKIFKKAGENMSEFDFDSLLDDVENGTVETVNEEVIPDVIPEAVKAEEEAVEGLTDEEIMSEVDTLLDEDDDDVLDNLADYKVPDIEVPQPPKDLSTGGVSIRDFLDEEESAATQEYIMAYNDTVREIDELKMKQKKLKDEAKEEGVPVTVVHKSLGELKKEIKETVDEAREVESMKDFIRSNAGMYQGVIDATEKH